MLKELKPDTIENGRAYFNRSYYQLCVYLPVHHFVVEARSYRDEELIFDSRFLGHSKMVTLKKYRSADPAKVRKELPKLEQRLKAKDRAQLKKIHTKNQAIKKMVCIARNTFGDLLHAIRPDYDDSFNILILKGRVKINVRNFRIVLVNLAANGAALPFEAALTAKDFNFTKDKNLYATYEYDHIPIEELSDVWQDLKRNTLMKRVIAETIE